MPAALCCSTIHAAQAAGKFREEIVPVQTVLKDPKTGARAVHGVPAPCVVGAGTASCAEMCLP